MDLNRRRFLQLGSAGILAPTVSLADWSAITQEEEGFFAIVQGATDETSTQIAILHHISDSLNFLATHGKESHKPAWAARYLLAGSDWVVSHVHFTGLSIGKIYQFLVRSGSRLIDRREFTMLNCAKTKPRIAVCSCMQDFLHHSGIWDTLRQTGPDVIFFVGDTVYADFDGITWVAADAKRLWRRHAETRNRIALFRRKRLIPILAVWDDHDYGMNNSDRNFPHKAVAKDIFNVFFPQDAKKTSSLVKGPGLSQKWSAFGQEFYFLDGRTFRAPESNDPEAMFGGDQSKWLFDHLSTSQRPSWMITGSQFFGGPRGKEAFESSFPDQFRAFTDKLKDQRGPYGFISGDIHYSEIMKIEREFLGYNSIEITSSSMHSFSIPGNHRRHPNPRRLAATSYHNFVVFDVEAGKEDLKIDLRSLRSGREAFSTQFHLRGA